jgi:hypothetical protein
MIPTVHPTQEEITTRSLITFTIQTFPLPLPSDLCHRCQLHAPIGLYQEHLKKGDVLERLTAGQGRVAVIDDALTDRVLNDLLVEQRTGIFQTQPQQPICADCTQAVLLDWAPHCDSATPFQVILQGRRPMTIAGCWCSQPGPAGLIFNIFVWVKGIRTIEGVIAVLTSGEKWPTLNAFVSRDIHTI